MKKTLFKSFIIITLISLIAVGCKSPAVNLHKLKAPVNILESFSASEAPVSVPADNDKLLIFEPKYTEPCKTKLTLLDYVRDTVICDKTFDGNLSPVLNCDKSKIIVSCSEEHCFYFLNSSLEITKTFTPETLFGCFSYDADKYYFLDNTLLYEQNVETDEVRYIEIENDVRLQSIYSSDTESGMLFGSVIADNFGTSVGIVSISDGHLSLLTDRFNYGCLYGWKYFASGIDENDSFFACIGSPDSEETERILSTDNDNFNYYFHDGCSFILGTKEEWNEELQKSTQSVRVCNLYEDGIKYSDLSEYGFEYGLDNVSYSKSDNLIFGAAETESGYKLVIIDPEQLDFKDYLKTERYLLGAAIDFTSCESNVNPETNVTDKLREARAYADTLEQKYGIDILLSNQCAFLNGKTDFTFKTSNNVKFSEAEEKRIMASLKQLESILEKYPAGFFDNFKSRSGTGGLRFMLTGKIDGTEYNVEGFQAQYREWYNVVLDITLKDLSSSYHHEIWHAIECLINQRDGDLLSGEKWNKLNPDGFEYRVEYFLKNKGMNYTFADKKTADGFYFVDTYGMIKDSEDRARIFEMVMSPHTYTSDGYMKSPHITEKLKTMSDAMRKTLTLRESESFYWERYF